MLFAWDEDKAKENQRKHRVTFEESETVFDGPLAKTFLAPDHSEGAERYLEFGHSDKGRLLIVSYMERQERIRIISCRPATRKERRDYEER